MNKQSFTTILLTMLMSMIGTKAFAYDFLVKNSDGVTIYYEWANEEKTEIAVSQYYSSYYRYSVHKTREKCTKIVQINVFLRKIHEKRTFLAFDEFNSGICCIFAAKMINLPEL